MSSISSGMLANLALNETDWSETPLLILLFTGKRRGMMLVNLDNVLLSILSMEALERRVITLDIVVHLGDVAGRNPRIMYV